MSLCGFALVGTFGIGALSYMSPMLARQKFETEFTNIEKELGYDFCFSAERLLTIMKYNNLREAINLETTPLLDVDQSENLSL